MEKENKVDFEVDLDAGKTKIEAPWGATKIDIGDNVGLIRHALDQLKYYRDVQGNKTQHLANDIKGYEQVLNSGDLEKNAWSFLRLKHQAMLGQRDKFKDNLAVIAVLKEDGVWVE